MCMSSPKAKPVPNAPIATPTSIDQETATASRNEMIKNRRRYGQANTILAGAMGGGNPPTMPVKTALGA